MVVCGTMSDCGNLSDSGNLSDGDGVPGSPEVPFESLSGDGGGQVCLCSYS